MHAHPHISRPEDSAPGDALRAMRGLGLDPDGAEWVPLRGGRVNRLWRVGERVVKLYHPAGATPLFPNDAAAEVAALTALRGRGIAPCLVAAAPGATLPCLVYRHLDGPAGAAAPQAVGALLARLHAEPPPAGLRNLPGGPAILDQGDAMLAALPAAQAGRLRALRPSVAPPAPEARVFLHGDPVPANIVSTADGPRLIDWQCPAIGDPAEDLALYLSPAMQAIYGQGPLSPAQEAAFLDAYGHPARRAALAAAAPARHWRMAVYCLWKAARGDTAYAAAAELELERLE